MHFLFKACSTITYTMEQQQQPIIHTNGTQSWWVNDKRHREGDMPAIIGADGAQRWYVTEMEICPRILTLMDRKSGG